jgi:hypothetical protein
MQGKHIYEYSVIRLVPRVEREEFINIGIILFCKHQNYLNVRFELNSKRIFSLFPNIDIDVLHSYIDEIKNVVENKCDTPFVIGLDIPSKFRWLSAKKSTMIQYSAVHIGTTDDLNGVMDHLVKMMVLVST